MSEDQIRTELAEIRKVQRESQAEVLGLISGLRDEIIDSVREHNEQLKAEVEERTRNSISNFRWTMGVLITICLGIFSWFASSLMKLNESHNELKADFGYALRITASQHKDAIGFDELMNKYYPTRGIPE